VALSGGLDFAHLWGLLFNFTTSTPFEGATLDASMVGLYVGAIALPLAALSLLRERDPTMRAVAIAAGGMLLMSLGAFFFGRVALHWLVPTMNISRFPAADSRTSMVLCLALLAGSGARLLHDSKDAREVAFKLYAATWAGLGVAMVALRRFAYRDMAQTDYLHRVVGGLTAQMLLIGVLLLALGRRSRPRVLLGCLATLLVVDLGTSAILNYAAIGMRVSASERRARESTYRHVFDGADVDVPRIAPDAPNPELQRPAG